MLKQAAIVFDNPVFVAVNLARKTSIFKEKKALIKLRTCYYFVGFFPEILIAKIRIITKKYAAIKIC